MVFDKYVLLVYLQVTVMVIRTNIIRRRRRRTRIIMGKNRIKLILIMILNNENQ